MCLFYEGTSPWKCKGPIFITEGFIAEKGVFYKDKQVPQIVAKDTKYIFALHLELACSYHLFIACTINDCKSLKILQRSWQSILQQEIYREKGWGKDIQPCSLLFWHRNHTLTYRIIECSVFSVSARCVTYAEQFQFTCLI